MHIKLLDAPIKTRFDFFSKMAEKIILSFDAIEIFSSWKIIFFLFIVFITVLQSIDLGPITKYLKISPLIIESSIFVKSIVSSPLTALYHLSYSYRNYVLTMSVRHFAL